ncbi:tRNA (adenosine(37)-N6)-threonylcarbamoyltransferase complex ATPase subunit type 1 TsaE [Zhouia amylolytica]|uniref:tRNA (adenosine(37)-N6)-threonylcarbamoyltransferase complex ATPase subunit type 1 TsaE n=1 Tax=Zhouia amylolytica TaxID=376730 RepID=UPI0020CDD524|nr:tRNA (adenosine(37)-N6)-threonylcarbamoyltransferase complex ATPase subunit type 1 TsaE [Zhouia amylolytica]MCQ0110753.1 tRNA (adenosine(37)-N6)-threonylcarbamoyltransferase complex ATPase subunit type 1 TsaE [Zhouia amylolytica]
MNYTLTDIPQVANYIIKNAKSNILLFYGEMGVGKTTLIKEIVKELGVNDVTSSPTFSIVNEYEGNSGKIYHFDFYRLETEEEAYDIGFEDYIYTDAICLIEWPEKIENLLPENATKIMITKVLDNKRSLILK